MPIPGMQCEMKRTPLTIDVLLISYIFLAIAALELVASQLEAVATPSHAADIKFFIYHKCINPKARKVIFI